MGTGVAPGGRTGTIRPLPFGIDVIEPGARSTPADDAVDIRSMRLRDPATGQATQGLTENDATSVVPSGSSTVNERSSRFPVMSTGIPSESRNE